MGWLFHQRRPSSPSARSMGGRCIPKPGPSGPGPGPCAAAIMPAERIAARLKLITFPAFMLFLLATVKTPDRSADERYASARCRAPLPCPDPGRRLLVPVLGVLRFAYW